MHELTDREVLCLTVEEASAEMAKGRLNAERYAEAALRRIAEREPVLKAWAFVEPARALAAAGECDAGPKHGLLHGIPVGVKDVIDVAGMPTCYNSPLAAGHRAMVDAACVDMLRAAGAVMVGKTETTEFAAGGRLPRTRNPFDPERTSGGSSAGSAAAVADHQVPLALGTQTGGSTMRPASFCGVHAFKPSWGAVSREGVQLFVASFDTVSWFARSVGDLDLVAEVFGVGEPVLAPTGVTGLRIAFCRTPQWGAVEAPMRAAFSDAHDTLLALGAVVTQLELPPGFADLNRAHDMIAAREAGAAFRNFYVRRKDDLHDYFRALVENRAGTRSEDLRGAYRLAERSRPQFDEIAADFDVIIAPSAPGEAPAGAHPGSHVLNQIWSLLQTPCINLPRWQSNRGLPLGLTLTTRRFEDRRLLSVAAAIDRALASAGKSIVLPGDAH